jgi:DNA-binding beta-propeller fold protein YncE
VWATEAKANQVERVSEADWKVDGKPIAVGKNPGGIAVGAGGGWVANYDDKTITKIESNTGQVITNPIKLPFSPGGVAVIDGTLYAGTGSGIVEIDPTSFSVEPPVPLQGAAYYDVGLGSLWASFPTRGEIQRRDLKTKQEIGQPIQVGKGVQGVAVGIHGVPDVWTFNSTAGTATRISATAESGS